MSKEPRVIQYHDEQENFSKYTIKARKIDGSYKYVNNNIFHKALSFFAYRIVATPLTFLYLKCKFHIKVKNKEVLKKCKKQGYFIYGNHTQQTADAYIPTYIQLPKATYPIVHADNVSVPVIGKITPLLGALPVPDDIQATKNFLKAIEFRIKQNKSITIYPEAKIWPYYTGIRPFASVSFKYPVKLNTPVYCFTNTYVKRKFSNKPNIITYVDGPFYPDTSLPMKDAEIKLHDQVFSCMVERSKLSSYESVKYEKVEKEKNTND